jgi:hypothetical protein
MRGFLKVRYLYGLAILLWALLVIIYVGPVDDGHRNCIAVAVFCVGTVIIGGIRALWRWFAGHNDPWGNLD